MGNNNHWDLTEDRGIQKVGKERAGIFMTNIWLGEKVRSYQSNKKKKSTKQYQTEEFTIKNYLSLYQLLAFLTD